MLPHSVVFRFSHFTFKKTTIYRALQVRRCTLRSQHFGERVVYYHTVFKFFLEVEEQTVSPWSPTAARSPSSLWLRLSVSPPAGVWLLLLHQCPFASGSTSHLSTIWRIEGVKQQSLFLSEGLCFWILGSMICNSF